MLFLIDAKTADKFPSLETLNISDVRPSDVKDSADYFLKVNEVKELHTAAFLAKATESDFVFLLSAYTESKFIVEAEINHYATEDISHRINLIMNNSLSQKEIQKKKEHDNLTNFFSYEDVAHGTELPKTNETESE